MGNTKNFQLLLVIGIFASLLALISSIYGFINTSITPSPPKFIGAATSNEYQTFAQVPNVPEGLFYYGGSTTFASMRFTNLVSEINQAHPKFGLRYVEKIGGEPSSSENVKMLLAGELSFIQLPRPLTSQELSAANERGITLEEIPIAIDGIIFYTNSHVSVNSLSLAQIKDIYTGKITNWKSLGGRDLPIVPFSRDPNISTTASFIQEQVLGKASFSKNVQIVENTTDAIRKVATTPGGISYATASQVYKQKSISSLSLSRKNGEALITPVEDNNQTVNYSAFTNGSYPLTRKLFVVIKKGGTDEQAGVAYANLLLSDQGQRAIMQSGFAPIH